jgi:putative FmdB family regulatory protein
MPIYEYKCIKNGHVFEMLQKVNDPIPEKCTMCNSKVKRQISESTFHLKGSGWYKTDYQKKDSTKEKKVEPKKEDKKPETTEKTTKADNEHFKKAA